LERLDTLSTGHLEREPASMVTSRGCWAAAVTEPKAENIMTSSARAPAGYTRGWNSQQRGDLTPITPTPFDGACTFAADRHVGESLMSIIPTRFGEPSRSRLMANGQIVSGDRLQINERFTFRPT